MDETNIFNILDAIFTDTDVIYKVVDKRIVLTQKMSLTPVFNKLPRKLLVLYLMIMVHPLLELM